MKITVAYRNPVLPEEMIKRLEQIGEVEILKVDKISEEETIEKMPDTEILICGISGFQNIGKKTFDGLKRLKLIAMYGVGYEWIDVEEAKKRGIVVSATISANSESVAEHTWGMILDLAKKITEFERDTRSKGENNVYSYKGIEVYGKTLGIIGLGQIGKRVARIAKGFDMKIIGFNRSKKPVENVEIVDMENLLKNSDIIALCAPLNKDTENIISKKEIKMMKKDVILVNCSRGNLVEKKAVLDAVSDGKIFGYGIETDLFQEISPDDEYFKYPNVLLTPHNAWNTKESVKNNLRIILENVEAFVQGKLINVVNG